MLLPAQTQTPRHGFGATQCDLPEGEKVEEHALALMYLCRDPSAAGCQAGAVAQTYN